MKNFTLALAITTLFSSLASADIIRCNFTEPFYNTVYSMAQQSLTIHSFEAKKRVIKNVSFQIMGPARFNLVDKNGQILQELNLSFKGSDGMSDSVYPYEVKDHSMESGANNGIGACTSNYLKSKCDGGGC